MAGRDLAAQRHLAAARRKLRAARSLVDAGLPEEAAGEAYFAMLSAASAALAIRDRAARTHRGTWVLFADYFVRPGTVEKAHYDAAQRARELRELADYTGGGASSDEAHAAVEDAVQFVERIATVTDLEGDETAPNEDELDPRSES